VSSACWSVPRAQPARWSRCIGSRGTAVFPGQVAVGDGPQGLVTATWGRCRRRLFRFPDLLKHGRDVKRGHGFLGSALPSGDTLVGFVAWEWNKKRNPVEFGSLDSISSACLGSGWGWPQICVAGSVFSRRGRAKAGRSRAAPVVSRSGGIAGFGRVRSSSQSTRAVRAEGHLHSPVRSGSSGCRSRSMPSRVQMSADCSVSRRGCRDRPSSRVTSGLAPIRTSSVPG
jgi:hypothetical protein